jgi:hypothetical protein
MRFCRQIRNQFSHSIWTAAPSGYGLAIVDLDEATKSKLGSITTRKDYINLPLLQKHEEYFIYVYDCLAVLKKEYERLAGILSTPASQFPTKINRPPKYNSSP